MKSREYHILIRQKVMVYADTDEEAIDRALQEPIDRDSVMIMEVTPTATHKNYLPHRRQCFGRE